MNYLNKNKQNFSHKKIKINKSLLIMKEYFEVWGKKLKKIKTDKQFDKVLMKEQFKMKKTKVHNKS